MDDFLDIVGEYSEPHEKAAAIRQKPLRVMHYYISLPLDHEDKWLVVGRIADSIGLYLVYIEHPIGKAFLRKEVLSMMLKAAGRCKASRITQPNIFNEKRGNVIFAVRMILSGVKQYLTRETNLSKNVLRHGLLAFGGRYDFLVPQTVTYPLFTVFFSSLIGLFTHMLDDARVTMLLVENMMKKAHIVRETRERGHFLDLWNFMKGLALRHAVLLLLHRLPERIAFCDMVGSLVPL